MRIISTLVLHLASLLLATSLAAQGTGTSGASDQSQSIRALLTPLLESTLSSQIAGRIKQVSVTNGDQFRKGDRLIEFDCKIQKAQLQRARAELLAVQKRHEANLKLQEYNSIGDTEVAVSAAEVDKARAEVSLVAAQFSMCKIDAPFNGRVIKRVAQPYESVNQGEPLIEILDDSQLKVELYVPSRWLLWLKPGTRFSVHIDETGKTYPARVTTLGARVDAVSQSIEITAEIEGSHPELLAGMSGDAQFQVPELPEHP